MIGSDTTGSVISDPGNPFVDPVDAGRLFSNESDACRHPSQLLNIIRSMSYGTMVACREGLDG